MKHANKLYIISIFLLFLVISFLSPAKASANTVLFQDDFNDNDISDWQVTQNSQIDNPSQPCLDNGSQAKWQVVNGKVGIRINGPACITFMVPSSFRLPDNINYRYSVDVDYVGTPIADRMIAYRYKSPKEWYLFHTYSSGIAVQKEVNDYNRLDWLNYPFEANKTYHYDIDFIGNKVTLYINNVKIGEIADTPPTIQNATIALSAFVGADPDSETWYDNVKVTRLNPDLNVPLFKQGLLPYTDNNPVWEGEEFDHASKYGGFSCGTTIAQCGCAMTSLAMILQYYGVEKLPDGTPLDPGTFNTWLKNNNGYLRDEGLNPGIAATIAKLAKNQNPNFKYDAIEHKPHINGMNNTVLTQDLQNGQPDMLQEPGHFIVAKGIDNDTFNINDPAFSRTKLTDYSNSYLSIDRYVPANSDLSYLTLAVNPDINISMQDTNGNSVGQSYLQYHLIDATKDTPETASPSPSLNIGEYAQPSSGTYKIEISGAKTELYQLDIYTVDEEGNNNMKTITGAITPESPNSLLVTFDKTDNNSSQITKQVTFASTIEDITVAQELHLINQGLAIALIANVKTAEEQTAKHPEKSQELLHAGSVLLDKNHGHTLLISDSAYTILNDDFIALSASLQ